MEQGPKSICQELKFMPSLAEVGSEGVEIAGILGVDSRAQIKDRKYLIA